MTETIYRKVLVLQNGLSHEHFPVSFPNTSQKLLLKIEQKRLSLSDNIARCKNPRAVKDLSNSGSFFYLVSQTIFILFTRKFHVFFQKYSSQKIHKTGEPSL